MAEIHRHARIIACAAALTALFAGLPAWSSSGGIIGRTNGSGGAGCDGGGACHNQVQDTTTMSVSISAPSGLTPGSSGTVTVTATRATNPSARMGFNAWASQGSLGAGATGKVQILSGEATHLGPGTNLVTTNAGGSASYSFTVTMPASPNGVATTIQAVARIAFGGGWRHAASVTIPTTPAAPTINSTTPGNGSASVAFSAPAANGGSSITGYTANCGGFTAAGGASPLTVTGLTNGTTYNCSVTATNAVGTSAASSTLGVTPRTVPGAPTIGTATPGNASLSVSFSGPASNGGSAILDYTANCGGVTATGVTTPILVTGLVNGTPYTCTVTARNAAGSGAASAPTTSATPRTVPSAPVIGTAVAGNAQISVAFSPPASTGGSPITGYTANCGGITNTGAGSPIVVTGLANGTAYACTVTAQNIAGSSAPSSPANTVTPRTTPGAPTISGVAPGDGSATVSFLPPASDGGGTITSYGATCGAASASGPASPILVTGLANGVFVQCTVTATNVVGPGPASAPVGVTPAADPDGRLDPLFGVAGLSAPPFPLANDVVFAVAVDEKQRIVVGGARQIGGRTVPSFARFLGDGTLDTSFGTGGITSLESIALDGQITSLAITPSGDILYTGFKDNSGGVATFMFGRLTPEGAIDGSFGDAGIVSLALAAGSQGIARAIAWDEKRQQVVVAGWEKLSATPLHVVVVRAGASGKLVDTFGVKGVLNLSMGAAEANLSQGGATGVVLDSKGRALVGGFAYFGPSFDTFVLRADDAGLDTTYGTGGVSVLDVAGAGQTDAANAIRLDGTDGASVAGYTAANGSLDFLHYRLDGSGALASLTITDLGGSATDVGNALVIQPDGKHLVGGVHNAGVGTSLDFAFVRHLANGPRDTTFAGTGFVSLPITGSEQLNSMEYHWPGTVVAAVRTGGNYRLARFVIESPLPLAFSPSTVTAVGTNTLVQSSAMAVPGIAGETYVVVQNGEWSRNCLAAGFTTGRGLVTPGDTVCVRHVTAATTGITTTTTLWVGGQSATFASTPNVVTPMPTLTVIKAGAGSGIVSSSPAGINCGATCAASFPTNQPVTLFAGAAVGSVFAGWSGGGCTGTGSCLVTMDAAKSVTATFNLQSFTLTVSKAGTGTGTVTSSPAGVDCGATCTPSFNYNTVVTLTASATGGSTFTGWGGACAGTGSCQVAMDQARAVSASFAAPTTFTLTVTNPTATFGNVFSSPGSIACGVTCSEAFAAGTVVTLTASPNPNRVFAGWTGACTGTGTCQVTMDQARTVGASFVSAPPVQVALTVSKAGGGSGLVTSTPGGIDCGATCSASYNSGVAVSLGAAPAADSFFAGWSGACTGTGACNVTMDAAKSVTATFKLNTTIPRLANIATRMQVLTGADVMIGGFIIGGSQAKTVVVRARGPSLTAAGVPGALANPVLQLFSGQTQLAANDNWQQAANAAAISASGFAPSDPLESAILTTLTPGAYTAIVSGAGGGTGVGIVEVFEVDLPQVPLLNIATRGKVLTGADVMIGGFIIQGDAPQTVIVRARGPSLTAAGVPGALQDPVLQLFSGQTQIGVNDDWQADPNAGQIQSRGFAPSDARESAILVTLPPGAYTAIVTGKNATTGVAIIEVFAQ